MGRLARAAAPGLAAIGLVLAGPALGAKVDLVGASANLTGWHKMVFKDADTQLTCPKDEITGGIAFAMAQLWSGMFETRMFDGTYKQKDAGGRTVVLKLSPAALNELNQSIDDFVSSCIWSIPDGLPVKFKSVKFKGKINKARDKLTIKGVVEFRSKEVGIWWDMRGDSSDVYTLKLKGPLTLVPPEPM